MTSTHAAGVRIPFAEAPPHVRGWVESRLGGPVVQVTDCRGGMSPGPAARVVADGGLPSLPWRRADLARVVDVLVELREVLEGVSVPGVVHAAGHAPIFTTRGRELARHLDEVEPWWREHHDALAEHASRAAGLVVGQHLLHWDVRSDNVILGPERTVLVDWGQARVGAAWMDHALLALDCSMSGSELSTAEFARLDLVLRERDPAGPTAVAAVLALACHARALAPVVPSLPTMNETAARWAESLVSFLDEALAG